MSDRSSTSGDGTGVPDIDALSGAYALNALSDEERALFEARMSESDDITTEVAEMNETALLLGHAVQPVAPSPALRASIMGLIASTPQLPAQESDDTVGADTDATRRSARHAHPADADRSGEILEPTPLARQRWFTRPAVLLVGAAAAAGLFFGGAALNQNISGPGSSQSPQAAAPDVSQILAAKDVQHTVADVSTGGKASLYWSSDLKRSAVILDGVTALPSDKTYQLWYINGKSVKSAGTVSADSNTVTQVLQGDMTKGDTVGITVEPRGGSKQPTSKPVVAITV